jgi:hypothetical protein
MITKFSGRQKMCEKKRDASDAVNIRAVNCKVKIICLGSISIDVKMTSVCIAKITPRSDVKQAKHNTEYMPTNMNSTCSFLQDIITSEHSNPTQSKHSRNQNPCNRLAVILSVAKQPVVGAKPKQETALL